MGERIRKNFRQPGEETGSGERVSRRIKKRRGGLRLLVRIMIVAVALLCVYALFANWKDLAPDSFVAWVEDVFSGTTGGTWPVTLTGDNVTDMQEVGGNLVLLTDTATVYYNGNGGESLRRTCAYAKPLMRVRGKYALLLEMNGSRYRLETRSGVESEMQVSNTIYTGAVSRKGDVAVVTDSAQSYISEVTVYSRSGEQRYQWLSSEWLVMDASFSADGNSLAVVGCRAQNGAMQSAIMVFDLRGREEQPKQFVSDDTTFSRVHYMSGGTVVALGDAGVRFVNPTGSLDVTVPHTEEEIVGFAFGEGEAAVVTRPYGSQDGGTVFVYAASGDLRTSAPMEGAFRDVAAMDGSFLVLTDQYVYQTGGDGFAHRAPAQADSLMTGAIDGKPLVLGLTLLSPAEWEW